MRRRRPVRGAAAQRGSNCCAHDPSHTCSMASSISRHCPSLSLMARHSRQPMRLSTCANSHACSNFASRQMVKISTGSSRSFLTDSRQAAAWRARRHAGQPVRGDGETLGEDGGRAGAHLMTGRSAWLNPLRPAGRNRSRRSSQAFLPRPRPPRPVERPRALSGPSAPVPRFWALALPARLRPAEAHLVQRIASLQPPGQGLEGGVRGNGDHHIELAGFPSRGTIAPPWVGAPRPPTPGDAGPLPSAPGHPSNNTGL